MQLHTCFLLQWIDLISCGNLVYDNRACTGVSGVHEHMRTCVCLWEQREGGGERERGPRIEVEREGGGESRVRVCASKKMRNVF